MARALCSSMKRFANGVAFRREFSFAESRGAESRDAIRLSRNSDAAQLQSTWLNRGAVGSHFARRECGDLGANNQAWSSEGLGGSGSVGKNAIKLVGSVPLEKENRYTTRASGTTVGNTVIEGLNS